ncbi:hypothetical protein PSACC_00123 [Paramicrosporidium saccamoebae]|uniref:WW domain-containing protein n=1 Tax=Paramicrosporidium saccamoebae TaxID=1246581 RepID=A0A2H9TQP2_9FUNG|nr:hypothetical protein PSACC_00123 [Paramicrosporidium saccamoebae]
MNNGQTSWEEPAEVAAEALRASVVPIAKPRQASNSDIVSSWREMVTGTGRKYYYNAVTKMSMWEVPPEYAEYLERIKDPASIDKEVLEAKFMAMLKEKLGGGAEGDYWPSALQADLQREVEREERQQRSIQAQDDLRALFRATSEITSTTRYSEVLELLEGKAAFNAVANPKERASLFDEHISELRREEMDRNRQKKKRTAEKFQKLLASIPEIRIDTLWRNAVGIFRVRLQDDVDLSGMELMEQLAGYENYIKGLERADQQNEIDRRDEERKRERLNRKAFKTMLGELEENGTLRATSSWTEIYPLIKDRKEYIGMLSQSGSTPLDLFWDCVHRLQESYVKTTGPVIHELLALKEGWMDNTDLIQETATRHHLDPKLIDTLQTHINPSRKPSQPSAEETRALLVAKLEKHRITNRTQLDRLKHAIKHMTPPIQLDSQYEQYRTLIPDEVQDEDIRRYYFEKFIRHLKKKAGLVVSDDE